MLLVRADYEQSNVILSLKGAHARSEKKKRRPENDTSRLAQLENFARYGQPIFCSSFSFLIQASLMRAACHDGKAPAMRV